MLFQFNFFDTDSLSSTRQTNNHHPQQVVQNNKDTKKKQENDHCDENDETIISLSTSKQTLTIVRMPDAENNDYSNDSMYNVSYDYDTIPISTSTTDDQTTKTYHLKRIKRPPQRRQQLPSSSNTQTITPAPPESDLISGIYEGGLKTWECSIDLCCYLWELYNQNNQQNSTSSTSTGCHQEETNLTMDDKNEEEEPLTNLREIIYNACFGDSTTSDQSDTTNNKTLNHHVMEFGCGHGLPGILLHKLRRKRRKEQSQSTSNCYTMLCDYNDYVLRDVTWPNVILNLLHQEEEVGVQDGTCHDNRSISNSKDTQLLQNEILMVAGDWMELSQQLLLLQYNRNDTNEKDMTQQTTDSSTTTTRNNILFENDSSNVDAVPSNGKFHCLLAAETLYTPSSCHDMAILLKRHLLPQHGVALIASKRFYFGVGGGIDCFQEEIRKLNLSDKIGHQLHVTKLREYDDGKSNIRDLLCVQLL